MQRRNRCERHGLDARAPSESIGHDLKAVKHVLGWRARHELRRRENRPVYIVPEIDGAHVVQAAHEQPGADEEHDRQSRLHCQQCGA